MRLTSSRGPVAPYDSFWTHFRIFKTGPKHQSALNEQIWLSLPPVSTKLPCFDKRNFLHLIGALSFGSVQQGLKFNFPSSPCLTLAAGPDSKYLLIQFFNSEAFVQSCRAAGSLAAVLSFGRASCQRSTRIALINSVAAKGPRCCSVHALHPNFCLTLAQETVMLSLAFNFRSASFQYSAWVGCA